MLEFVDKKKMDFQDVKYLVFDGLDLLINNGFESAVYKIMQHEIMPEKGKKQVLLLSASITTSVIHFSNFLENNLFLTVENTSRIENHFSDKFILISNYIFRTIQVATAKITFCCPWLRSPCLSNDLSLQGL